LFAAAHERAEPLRTVAPHAGGVVRIHTPVIVPPPQERHPRFSAPPLQVTGHRTIPETEERAMSDSYAFDDADEVEPLDADDDDLELEEDDDTEDEPWAKTSSGDDDL
jgi:hypothetical protein